MKKTYKKIDTSKWLWQPHPGHFMLSDKCRFFLNTYLGNGYLVSTVGELWNDRPVREIHAKIADLDWYEKHKDLKGEKFDAKYFKKFGYADIGYKRKYETMVFRAKPIDQEACGGCLYDIITSEDVAMDGYNSAQAAREGHYEMCEEWATKKGNNL